MIFNRGRNIQIKPQNRKTETLAVFPLAFVKVQGESDKKLRIHLSLQFIPIVQGDKSLRQKVRPENL